MHIQLARKPVYLRFSTKLVRGRNCVEAAEVMKHSQTKCENVDFWVLLCSSVVEFPTVSVLHPSAGTSTMNAAPLREGPPTAGTNTIQNLPRGNFSNTHAEHSKTDPNVCKQMFKHNRHSCKHCRLYENHNAYLL